MYRLIYCSGTLKSHAVVLDSSVAIVHWANHHCGVCKPEDDSRLVFLELSYEVDKKMNKRSALNSTCLHKLRNLHFLSRWVVRDFILQFIFCSSFSLVLCLMPFTQKRKVKVLRGSKMLILTRIIAVWSSRLNSLKGYVS